MEALAAETGADELMVNTMLWDHEARKRSYALLAEAFGLSTQSFARRCRWQHERLARTFNLSCCRLQSPGRGVRG